MRPLYPAAMAFVAVAGCVRGAVDPTPPPALTGAYLLTVQASPVCRLSVSRFEWEVEGTASGTEPGAGVRLTLPGGDNTVDLSLTYRSETLVSGTLSTRLAPLSEELKVTMGAGVEGPLSRLGGGRGQVLDGPLNGTIGLSGPEDRESDAQGSCTAANHRWTLVTR